MSERKREQLVGKQDPYMSLRMSPDPITLGPGEFSLGTNLRTDNGIPTVRNGIDRVNRVPGTALTPTATVTSGHLLGEWFGCIGGAYRKVVALQEAAASTTRLYELNSNGTTGTEITATSGQWGDTRLTQAYNDNEPSGHIQFTLVSDQLNNTTKLIATNGVDAPRVIYHTGSSWVCAVHNSIAIPERNANQAVVFKNTGNLNLKLNTATSYTSDTGRLTGADDSARFQPATAADGNAAKFTVRTTVVAGDEAAVVSSTTMNPSNCRQVWVGIDTAIVGWIEKFKVSLYNSAGTGFVLWDPSLPQTHARPVGIPLDDTTKRVWLFNLPRNITSVTDVDRVTFEYIPAYSLAVEDYFWCFLCACGGTEPGGTLYATTHYSPYSHAESPGVVIKNYSTVKFEDMGAPSMDGMIMPNRSEVKYKVTTTTLLPNASVIDDGVDSTRFYSMLDGQDEFFLFYTKVHATFGAGVWSVTTDNTGLAIDINDAATPYFTQQKLIRMPDQFHKPIPSAAMGACYASGRLFTSASSDTANDELWDTLWVSQVGNPYRFRQDLKRFEDGSPNESSAITIPLNGESVRRIEATTDHTRTGSLVCVATNSSVRVLRGSKASDILNMSTISSYGIQSPRAMASYDGALAWMSNSGHVTYFKGGETQELSYRSMEDQVAPVTLTTYGERTPVVSMAFCYGRLYVARRGATTSYQLQGDLVMVYDFRHGAWVGEDAIPAEAPIHALVLGEGGVKETVLYIVGRYGDYINVYEYDSYGLTTDEQSDAGHATNTVQNNIAYALKTRDKIYGPDAMRVTLGRIGVFCSKLASGTMTLLRTYRPTGVTGTTTISLSATPSELHVIDDTPTSSDVTVEHWGAAANVKMSGTAPGGFQIFNAFVEVGARGDSHASG